jgi:hypothetical protein
MREQEPGRDLLDLRLRQPEQTSYCSTSSYRWINHSGQALTLKERT